MLRKVGLQRQRKGVTLLHVSMMPGAFCLAFTVKAPLRNVQRILEVRTVDEDIETWSWDWIPVCLTSHPSSRFFLERGQGVEHMCVFQAIWNSEELLSPESCLDDL